MLAAMASESGTVGFIGGMDIPLIRHFGCGYAQGAKAANPDVTVLANMTGTTPAAWNDPVKGRELTKSQISQGADVVYAAAGGTGVGVLQAADRSRHPLDRRRFEPEPPASGQGSDLDAQARRQRRLRRLHEGRRRPSKPAFSVMGLANDGVGYAMDDNNQSLSPTRWLPQSKMPRPRSSRARSTSWPTTPTTAAPHSTSDHDAKKGADLPRGHIPGGAASAAPAIELKGISKAFGPVQANKDISIRVMPGTIHGIIGENGAGKSTLMSILYGFYKADAGEIFIQGKKTEIPDSQAAIAAGIGMVFQHFKLVENFTVLENVVLGAEDGALLKPSLAKAAASF